jgi:hypothetical protein
LAWWEVDGVQLLRLLLVNFNGEHAQSFPVLVEVSG